MAFEHYLRKGTKMLRYGYTTGTCAALAAAAATRILLTGCAPESVSLMTAKGIPVEVPLTEFGTSSKTADINTEKSSFESAWAAIPKDAGDDSDVTDGMLIRADVSPVDILGTEVLAQGSKTVPVQCSQTSSGGQVSRITIDGGKGIGRVTKPGLDQPVGNAAINSGPRKMIEAAVRQVLDELDFEGGIKVIISAPEGEEAAKRTFNSNLGIEGGISILGTTGIVEPMSEQALIDTIEVELNQIALSSKDLIITPGNYGSSFIQASQLEKLEIPVLKFSNFLGETLDMIAGTQIRNVLLVAHVGKLSKVAAGIMNTHSKYADGRNEIFCAHGAICGASQSLCMKLMNAATTDACIELLDTESLRQPVITSILTSIQNKLEHRTGGKYRIGALMFSNVYGTLGMTDTATEILQEWEDNR